VVEVPDDKPNPPHLVLERGFIPGPSPLRKEIEGLLGASKFEKRTIHVMLLNELGLPTANWLFFDASLIDYSLGDLDADQNSVFVESIAFQYSEFKQLSL
jgi:phage tail-like protein